MQPTKPAEPSGILQNMGCHAQEPYPQSKIFSLEYHFGVETDVRGLLNRLDLRILR